MTNLIIMVLVAALGSILTLVTISYGGSIYADIQAKSRAQTILSQAQRIAVAWRAWSRDNGGTSALSSYDWSNTVSTNEATLVSPYMGNYTPVPPLGLLHSTCQYWAPINDAAFGWTAAANGDCLSSSASVNALVLRFAANLAGQKTCEQLAALARGSNAAVLTTAGTDFASVMTSNKTFDCVYYNSATHYFVYRVFQ